MGLPSVESRENILRTLLAKEKLEEGLDFKEIATMTEGYSGSDLKVYNFCLCSSCSRVPSLFMCSHLNLLGNGC